MNPRAGLLLVVLLHGAACAQPGDPFSREPTAEEVAEGKGLYAVNGCATCHGRDGRGDGRLATSLDPRPRDFTRTGAFKGPRTMAAVADVIAHGIPSAVSAMPGYAHLDVTSRRQLAAYVLSIGGGTGPAP